MLHHSERDPGSMPSARRNSRLYVCRVVSTSLGLNGDGDVRGFVLVLNEAAGR